MKLGIVGLPNIGRSMLFNLFTKIGAESANNIGVIVIPDERLDKMAVSAVIEFVDITGLVKGVSKEEGNNYERQTKK